MSVYDDIKLYSLHDKFIVQPKDSVEELIINRINGTVTVQGITNQFYDSRTLRHVCGILGTIKLISGKYLVVATHRDFVGVVNGHVIWRLAGHDLIPYIPSSIHLSETQKVQNETYLSMINQTLNTPFFYFSYAYDLTHTLQRLSALDSNFYESGMAQRADSRFMWNGFLLKDFLTTSLRRFCLPIVHGFISINQVNVNNSTFTWALISRRSVYRAGTRFFRRGIDKNGDCANFVETEQIVTYLNDKVSFVQIRGSIPLYWSQSPNIRYKPALTIDLSKEHLSAALKHAEKVLKTYGRHVYVNLIDHRGKEELLEKGFANLISQLGLPNIRYESFDFHAECRKMQWHRLNILIDRLAHEQDEMGVFQVKTDGTVISTQSGVFRTNCIDCLDRTNVVQSMLARRSLQQVLEKLNILSIGQTIQSVTAFDSLFKNVWADNADLISLQYSGTGALKTDFTRTGKRTIQGAMQDGVNSLTRYIKNNFSDGFRQDAINLFLGNYVIQEGEGKLVPCPLEVRKGWKQATFPSVLVFAVAMFCASVILPQEYNTENLLFMLFWSSMIGVTLKGIFRFGSEFVDFPKLLPCIDQNNVNKIL
ncbi:phosphatidylinositide phosphatase SAC1 [Contarinia nasturtii]|uniref:phosphatidylinositide phosphatase SAC1 n=1 Tax=Contarinia nasturtii TaxID=265458 RepID=UPI0012D42C2F|nr:phosphatidylinositide phosphatase SAC1 [Contarinia nasturtii]